MAEVLAGLLASAIVRIAMNKLVSAIGDQANLLWNFRDDLENMKQMLESISAALQDAEKRSAKDKLVQLWLKRLKHAALDISDMLEDYLGTRKTAKMPGVPSCLPIARKKCVMAKRMKSMRAELTKITEQFKNFTFNDGTSTHIEQHNDIHETSSRLPPEGLIIGRNEEKQKIINLLQARTNNDDTVIVPIYGLPGMGKTTLAQLVYNDAEFKKYDHRIWVYVSQDFSLTRIGRCIISLLPTGGGKNMETLELINQHLDNLLNGKKVLIVLDDLWEDKDLELEKLKNMIHLGKKGTMIDVIVTTRREDIARKVSTYEPYKLLPLKHDICWEIIKRYSKFEDQHNKERVEIGLDIAKKCGGVALAAQALGYILRSKDLSYWKTINNSDVWNESSEDDGGVLPFLKLSYERMAPQLRICFSYCAIFPKGHNITEDDLIHQWMAIGYIEPSKGKEYFKQLLGMSFLQVSRFPLASGEYMMRYTMHDLVHDLAMLIMADELIVSDVASKSSKNKYAQKYCRYALVTKYDSATKLSNIFPSKVRALNFSISGKLDLTCGAFSFAKCLRILNITGHSTVMLPATIGKMKQLKYLGAPRLQSDGLPEYITMLSNLQYLNLNESSRISALPESIGKLKCLEYLGLSSCSGISKLPESFGELKCMKHLHMSGCSGIRELPESFGNLTNLKLLELSQCSSLKDIPELLCSLTQLQYLNLSSSGVKVIPEAIGSLVNLQYLNMSYCGVRELPESFKSLCNLLHLDLKCSSIEKGLPGALQGLTALQYLDMSTNNMWAQNLEKDNLPIAMRSLTNLEVLNLAGSLLPYFDVLKNDDCLEFIATFNNLEHLDLSRNFNLYYLPESIGNLKKLHTLNLERCSGLKSLPESIGGATALKSLILNECSDKVIDQANSLLHYSLTLPLFKVRAYNVSAHSNLHLLENENVSELQIVSLENVRLLEEAQTVQLLTKQNLLRLTLAWTPRADRHLEDKDLLGQLVPPMSLQYLTLKGYHSPNLPTWLMSISHHLPNLTCIQMDGLPTCSNLPPLGQLPHLEILSLWSLPSVTKIDMGICGGKGAFPRLAKFKVGEMQGLEEWNTTYRGEDGVEEFMFPVLDVFEVFGCPQGRSLVEAKLGSCPPLPRDLLEYMLS